MHPDRVTRSISAMAPEAILDDIREEGVALVTAAIERQLPLRLMGGLAVWAASPSARQPPLVRPYPDIDLAAERKASQAAMAFLADRGYVPERLFNSIHGAQRLNLGHPDGRWTIDILLDEMRMSHTIPLQGRLLTDGSTIDLADLLLTKLQIWEINAKDLRDAAALLVDHALVHRAGRPSTDAIDLDRMTSLAGRDWGLNRTLALNLESLDGVSASLDIPDATRSLSERVATILDALDRAPKSLGWQARARIGERVRWYETPEEVRHEASRPETRG
jgi:hypothetical protein